MNKTKHIAAIAVGIVIALAFYGALAACAVQQGGAIALNHSAYRARMNRRKRRAEQKQARQARM